jgi:hypothetical protein
VKDVLPDQTLEPKTIAAPLTNISRPGPGGWLSFAAGLG